MYHTARFCRPISDRNVCKRVSAFRDARWVRPGAGTHRVREFDSVHRVTVMIIHNGDAGRSPARLGLVRSEQGGGGHRVHPGEPVENVQGDEPEHDTGDTPGSLLGGRFETPCNLPAV